MHVAIIGGGAAGFFAAIQVRSHHPKARVTIFEKIPKLLAKVRISGGGRCNVTNACPSLKDLVQAYPRGGKQLKGAFRIFSNRHMIDWLEERGIDLVEEAHGHLFPATQTSQTIIDCFLRETRPRVGIHTGRGVVRIEPRRDRLILHFAGTRYPSEAADRVIVATGGSPKRSGLAWLEDLGHRIIDPVPSLFTFNMPGNSVRELMGVSADRAQARISTTKLQAAGPVLITHWGMSGPAILKLSAWGARELYERNYQFETQINWADERNQNAVADTLRAIAKEHAKKQLSNYRPYGLPERLWLFLLEKCNLTPGKRWEELGNKGHNKLVNILTHDAYPVQGKTTYKEEFVTSGGVHLDDVDFRTLQSKIVPGLYFAGEVLDVDGITGGYNFQAAWTTAYIASRLG